MKKVIATLFTCFLLITSNAQCNLQAPTASSVEICANSTIPALTASTTEAVIQWRWFDETNTLISWDSNTYTPTISNSTAGTYTFYVSYTTIDAIELVECESPKTAITINVIQIAPPTVTSGNPMSLVVQVDDTFLPGDQTTLAANGIYTIEWMDATCTTVNTTGSTLVTGLGAFELGAFTYKVRQTDIVSGCSSTCENAEIVISKCPAQTPSAIDPYFCVGEATPLTVTATPNGVQETGDKLVWFSTINTASVPIPGFDGVATYSEAISTALPTTKTVYVAQYNAANTCYSSPKAVTITVVENPSVILTIPSELCAVDGLVNITTIPNGGTLSEISSIGGLNAVARTWDPMFGGAPSPSKTLQVSYQVTETHPDGKVCSTTEIASSTAHFMAPPIPENKSWLIGDIASIPSGHMTQNTSGIGTTIQWYKDAAMTQPLSLAPFSAGTLVADRAELAVEVGAATNYTKIYWITQTNAEGCESEPIQVELLLGNCAFTAPTVVGEEQCQGVVLNNITATKPAAMTEAVDEWRWYTTSNGGSPIYTGGSSYAHGVSNITAGTTTFWVSYAATELVSGNICESPRKPVSVIVNPLPTVTIDEPKTVLCYDQGDELIENTVSSPNGIGTTTWTVNGASAGITSGGIFNPTFAGQVTATYTLGLSYTDAKGCTNSTTKNIDVQYSPAPTTIGHLSMTIADIDPVVEATGLLPLATVKWYAALTGGTSIGTGTPWFTGDPGYLEIPSPGKNYYATQTVNGCESNKTPVGVIIEGCNVPAPIVIQPSPICNYEQIPELTASIGTWINGTRPTPTIPVEFRYYANATAITTLATNTTGLYTPTIDMNNAGTYTYYVSEYNQNITPQACEGPRSAITITINSTQIPTVLSPVSYCINSSSTPLTAIGNNLLWYSSEFGGTGSSTAPIPNTTNEGTFSYWVSQTINGCESPRAEIIIIIGTTILPSITTDTDFNSCEGTAINLSVSSTSNLSLIEWIGLGAIYLEGGTTIAAPTFSASAPSGTYNLTTNVTDEYGCTGTATQTITISPKPTLLIENSGTICSGSTLVLTVNSTPSSGVIYSWTGPQSFTSSIQNPTRTSTTTAMSGDYIVTANLNGCISSDTTTVTINQTPTVTISNNTFFCVGSTIQFTSNSTPSIGATYNWAGPSGFASVTQNPTLTNATTTMSGTYQVNATVNGCVSQNRTTSITVSPKPTVTASSNSPICQGSTLNLISTPSTTTGATYAWTGPNSYVSNQQNPIFTVNNSFMSGTYTVMVTVAGCTSAPASTVVTVNQVAPPTVSNPSYCVNTSASQLTAIGTNLKWYTTSTGGTGSSTAPIPFTTAAGTYNYWVTQTINGCESPRAQVIVTINSFLTPVITANPGFTVCQGNSISLNVTTGSSLTSMVWSGTGTMNLNGTTIPNPTFSASAPAGTYTLSVNVSDANGCVGNATKTIIVNSKPYKPSDKDISSQITQTTEILITDIVSPYTAKWYADESLTTLVNTGTSLQITDAVIQQKYYYVTQRNSEGCESEPALYTICSTSIPQVNVPAVTIQLPETLPSINCTTALGANEVVSWVYNEDTITGSLSYTPNTLVAGNYELFLEIKDTETGCVSDEFIVPITVHACLPLPTVVSDTSFSMYLHETPPTFEVQEPNTTWFDANYNQIGTGSTFTPLISRTGTFTFYAQQTNGSCVSLYKPFIVTVLSYSISGKVFFDRNEDGIFQVGNDVPVANQMLYIAETNEYIGTNTNGDYIYCTDTLGTYTISINNIQSNSEIIGTNNSIITLNSSNSAVSQINFRYKINPLHDISVDIYTYTSPVVGRTGKYSFYVRNNGIKQYNISLKIRYDNTKCSFNNTTIDYLSQAAGEIEYMIDSLENNSSTRFYVTLDILPDWTLTGISIPIYIEANTTNVDITPSNNIDSLFSIIRNSSDPNDKAVTPSLLEEGYVLMNSTLEYRIRFQNKGTADAWDIYIKDTIDENLDISTFNLVASSHDVHYTIQNRVVTFYFDSIMLPAEMYDTLGSNGFVVYTIDPIADLPEEAQAFNTAHIFFDFNPAVVTNTTQSTYVTVLPKVEEEDDITDIEIETIKIAPNPVIHSTTIYIAEPGEKEITITDASSKTIMKLSGTQNEFLIDCSTLDSGVYMCTIICNGNQYIKKIIIK